MSAVALHHRLSGPPAAPVVVLTGSLGTDLSMWEPQATALATRFRVLQVDLRGHGGSPVPQGPYSMADLGGDLVALLDRLGIERAALCGLSIGGMISLWVAAHEPARVQRLAVCCTTAYFGPEVSQAYRDRAELVRVQGLAAVADGALTRWFTPGFAQRHPDVVGRLREGLLSIAPEGYAGCCEALADLDLRPSLAGITAPTLVLAGEDDPATPPEHGEAIAAAIPQAEFELVACAAHLASVERAELVTALLLRFLQTKEPR